MKILFISHSAEINGAEMCLLTLLRNLDQTRFESVVVLPALGPLEVEFGLLHIKTHILPLEWWAYAEGDLLFRGQGGFKALEALRSIIVKEQPDIIHTNTAVIWEGAFLATQLGIPHVWHVHEIFAGHPTLQPIMSLPMMLSVMNSLTDSVVAVSNAVKKSLSPYISEDKIDVIYNGIEVGSPRQVQLSDIREELGIPADEQIALTIASIMKYKGIDDLVDAAGIVREQNVKIHFLIAGHSSVEATNKLQERIAARGVAETVHYLGFRADIRSIISAADFVVVPSINESFSLATAESLALGKPVIATDCGGPAEIIIDGETGLIVPVHDPQQLALSILAMAKDTDRLSKFGQNALTRFNSEFSSEVYTRKFSELYLRIGQVRKACHDPESGQQLIDGVVGLYLRCSELERERFDLEAELATARTGLLRGELTIAERDRWIAERDFKIAERDNWIAERDHWIGDRDIKIAERDRWIVERDLEISRLNQSGSELIQIIETLRDSLSWKVTQPLRWLLDKMKRLRADNKS